MSELRDRRTKYSFIHSDLDDKGLDPYAFRLYCRYCRRAGKGNEEGYHFEKQKKTAEQTQMTVKRLRKAKRSLKEHGMIQVNSRKGETDLIVLLPKSKWKQPTVESPEVPTVKSPAVNKGGPNEGSDSTNVESSEDAERNRSRVPPDTESSEENSGLPTDRNSPFQARQNIRNQPHDGLRVHYFARLFHDFFGSGEMPDKLVGKCGKFLKRAEQHHDDHFEWAVDALWGVQAKEEFSAEGPSDYQKSNKERAFGYLHGFLPDDIGEPEPDTDYTEDDVEQFVENGYDRDDFEYISQETLRYFPDD